MRSRRDLGALLVLAVLTAVAFAPLRQHEFVNYDDPDYVTDNALVRRGLSWEGLAWAFGSVHGQATYWHPLTWLSHMLDCELFGLHPGAHHLSSLLLHMANVLLLFVVLRRMTGAFWRSALVAGLFALHPLQVEAVAWVVARKNLVSALFWMLTLWAYLRYVECPSPGRYWPVPLLFTFTLMAKPVLVTLPFALLLLDFWPLDRWRRAGSYAFSGVRPSPGAEMDNPATASGTSIVCCHSELAAADPPRRFVQVPWRRLLLEKVPLVLLALGAGLIVLVAHRNLGMLNFDYGLTPALRIENAFVSYGRYVGNVFWPSQLCAIYPHPGQWPATTVAGSVLFVLLVSGWVLRAARRHPYLMMGWFWFLGLLLPSIGLLQAGTQAMADRFLYLPVIGLLLMAVWGAADLLADERPRHAVGAVLAVGTLVACLLVTSRQLSHWRNSVALYEHALDVTENNFVAHSNLGCTLERQGRVDEAMTHLVQALKIRPDFVEPRFQMALILNRVRDPNEAEVQLREVVRLDPNWSQPRLELAKVLTRLDRKEAAILEAAAAVRLAPADAEAHSLLAMLCAGRQQPAQAAAHYREALRLRPQWPEALNNLAWLLSTYPKAEFRDGLEAVRLAERACDLTHHEKAMFVGTLAAAYAESGRFAEAIQTAEQARAAALAAGDTGLAETNLKLIEFFRQGKPWQDEPR